MATSIQKISIKPQTPGKPGLPKISVESADITKMGLEGDYNNYRMERKNNDPDMAVMLISTDVIKQLNEEGWPVKAGDLGENLTLKGINYDSIQPGNKFSIGTAELEISMICDPCLFLYTLPYVGSEKGPAFLKTLKGRRGWYARVLKPGTVKTDDSVIQLGS